MDELVENPHAKAFSPREFIFRYIKYIPWLILSILLFLTLAWLKLRYSTEVYEVRSKLLIKSESPVGNGEKFQDIFTMGGSQNLNDEIEILRSTGLAKRIITGLGVQASYYTKGKVKTNLIHPSESPFRLEILELNDSTQGLSMLIDFINDNTFTINGKKDEIFRFGQVIKIPFGKIRLIKTPLDLNLFPTREFKVDWVPLDDAALGLAGSFKIDPATDFSNVLLITYETENPRLGREIVNQLMQEYKSASMEDKRTVTFNTLDFIDERLDTLKRDLGGVEQNLQNYREKNRAIDLSQQSLITFNELSEANKTLTTQDVQLKVIGYLQDYLANKNNINKTVPTQLGIQEPSLMVLIEQYNAAQLRRETQLKSTTAANPIIRDLDTDLEKLREQIEENLKNIRQSYVINRNNLEMKSRLAQEDISSVPGKAKRLLEITRQQRTLEELYSYLLQKRLETSISLASNISNSKVVEPAAVSKLPVKPKRPATYMFALFCGFALPLGFVFIKEYLHDKIGNRADIEKLTNTPILGEISHSTQETTLVVTSNNRKFIAEQFRIIRTNLQFILNKIDKPVIMVTSTFSGEGKSFISTNLGAVMALAGKKTVILEFDLRKPKILAGLNLKGSGGITNYIVSNQNIDEMIVPVTQVENLYVLPCGPIPPNPGELILDERVRQLFPYLRQHFDAIIVDSAPMGLVSDAVILNEFADATLYITRQNFTLKSQVHFINDLYENKRLKKVSLVLNDVKAGSGYGSSYGYGYGYGYGAGYFDEEGNKKKKSRNFLKRWMS